MGTQSPEVFVGRTIVPGISLQSSVAQTETNTGTTAVDMPGFEIIWFELDVTAAATATGDTLNVFIQTTIDGTNWIDIVHFTEVVGDGGAKRYVTKIEATTALTEFETGAALGAAAVRNILGSQYRARWAIIDVTTDNASFTFSITATGT